LLPEDVVAAADALFESQPRQKAPQAVKINVRIRLALKNPKPEFLMVHRR
jgi:hypothetical protein